jgi:hypothetical protein
MHCGTLYRSKENRMLPASLTPSLASHGALFAARDLRRPTQLPTSWGQASYLQRLQWLFSDPQARASSPTLSSAAPPTPQHQSFSAAGGAPVALDAEPAFAIQSAYAVNGGIAHGAMIVELLRDHASQPISRVARWIVARDIVQFRWRGETMFPLFQFDLTTMAVRQSAREVVAELAPAFDDLSLADWFVRPNGWLAGATPVAVVQSDPKAVLAAARADRFATLG